MTERQTLEPERQERQPPPPPGPPTGQRALIAFLAVLGLAVFAGTVAIALAWDPRFALLIPLLFVLFALPFWRMP